ncbi:MAG: glycosyltransferase family 4 protein [Candidatus Saganbacteria bacterium]|nr:glycosyltransferase family 4 protein [Candidatus Saganbacteria bacterium]
MKIAMLVPYFFPHFGGTEKYVKDLSDELADRGHDVTIISNNVPKEAGAPKEEMMGKVKVKRLDAKNYVYLPVSFQFNLKMLKGFDLVHTHCPPFGFTRAVRGRLKIPHVVTYHCDTTMSEKFLGIKMPKWAIKSVEWITNAYAKMILPSADAIISTTESYASTSPVMKNFAHFAVPIGIHYEVFDESRKKQGITEEKRDRKKVLFLGRFAANKGIDYLVRAIPLVLKEVPDAKFILCGEGEEKPHIEDFIDKVGVRNRIEFQGKVNLDKMVELYSTSAMFVFPSINRLEAFGIVQLESMACSTPVIASNIPGVNNVMDVGSSGLLVEPRDIEGLAKAIIEILKDPEKAKKMGERGRQLVETKYNWKTIGNQIEDIYRMVIERKKA